MPTIDLQSNIEEHAARLNALERKQLPFAAALASTRTAGRAQTKIRRNLPRRFTIRNKWVQSGIRVKPAKKTDPRPRAVVWSRDDFMYLHEEGGVKKPVDGKALAVPVLGFGRRGIVTSRSRPARLLRQYGYWVAPLGKHSKAGGIFHRKGPRRKRPKRYNKVVWRKSGRSGARYAEVGRKRQPIELVYVFTPQAKIEARFGFEEMTLSAVNRYFEKEFRAALAYALKTAR